MFMSQVARADTIDEQDIPPVTSITVTWNEEDYIGDCLDSIEWCDEKIVIDEYSEDNTVEIAESRGATVIQTETPDDANTYEILRGQAIEAANNDWILRIDADERSTLELNKRIQSLIRKNVADVIKTPRINYIGDKKFQAGSKWWPDWIPFVFKKDYMEVHDQIHTSLQIRPESDVIQLSPAERNAIHHYSYESTRDLLSRRWRWAKTEAELREYTIIFTLYSMVNDFLETFLIFYGWQYGWWGFKMAVIDAIYHLFIKIHQ
jgi:(heptosyl)LPS beta-1,4-glucosyltransferase